MHAMTLAVHLVLESIHMLSCLDDYDPLSKDLCDHECNNKVNMTRFSI